MKVLRVIAKQIMGLFLDDGFLAVAALLVIGAVAVLTKVAAVGSPVAGGLLLGGSVIILVASVWRAAHAR